MFSNKHILFALAFAHAATAAIHNVKVGADGLSFTPNTITAAKGDMVVYHFYAGHHNVVHGDFASPCTFANGGFFSGYIDSTSSSTPADNVFVVTINDTNPIWYYCSPHCESGMVGVINPPSSGNTLDEFLAGARSARESTTPAAVEGGVIEAANAVSSAASPSASASSTATSASSTSGSSAASGSAAETSATGSAASTGSSSPPQTASTTQASSSGTASASASAKPNGAVAMSAQNVVGSGIFALATFAVLLIGLI